MLLMMMIPMMMMMMMMTMMTMMTMMLAPENECISFCLFFSQMVSISAMLVNGE
jgi:hypothetical protein